MGTFMGAFPICTGPLAVQVVNRYKNGGVGTYCVQTRGFNRARRPLVGIFAKLIEPITATLISLNTQPNCRTCATGMAIQAQTFYLYAASGSPGQNEHKG
jgi:hypothetical protein